MASGTAKSAPAATGEARAEGTLVLGRVSDNPRKDYPALKSLADYLAADLHDYGISEGRVQFADDNDKMKELLRENKVDLVFDTVFAAVAYEEETGAKILLREWRDGAPTYRSILFKRKDTAITGLSDLVGRAVAFERAGSTTAYFVPRAEMIAAGLHLEELSEPSAEPSPTNVGYVFAGSENNIVVWVHRRLVAAGAFSDIDWDQSEDMPPLLRQDLEVFHQSAPLARALVIARHGLPARLEQQIRRILVAADTVSMGREVLKSKHVTKYDEVTGDAAASVAAARMLLTFSN